MLEVIGYISALLVGISLGLLGGGGSILSVPIFFYLFKLPAEMATTYSLFTVGAASIAGSIRFVEKKMVCYPALFSMGIPAVITGFLVRRFVIHELPETLDLGFIVADVDTLLMLLFSILMFTAAFFMIRGREAATGDEKDWSQFNWFVMILAGIGTGLLTSLIGAGGGFLIIPVLIKAYRLQIKRAIGTSLFMIMISALISFSGDVSANVHIDWLFLMKFTGISLIGIFIGIFLSQKISGEKLRPFFGYFVLIMAITITIKELLN